MQVLSNKVVRLIFFINNNCYYGKIRIGDTMKKNILLVLIGLVFGVAGTVIASNYLASDVVYNDTTVENALNELYDTQTTTITDLQSQIDNYKNKDCVAGSFVCTSCATSEGQLIADYMPSSFVFYANDFMTSYINVFNNSKAYIVRGSTSIEAYELNVFYTKNNTLTIHDWGADFGNRTINYIVCR